MEAASLCSDPFILPSELVADELKNEMPASNEEKNEVLVLNQPRAELDNEKMLTDRREAALKAAEERRKAGERQWMKPSIKTSSLNGKRKVSH
jgi:hypothetical protein